MKRLLSAALCAAILFSLASCGANPGGLPDPDAESVPPASAAPTSEPTPTAAPYTNPLTGEPMDEDISMNRPWGVMINNLPPSLPQRGVSEAEILFEIPAEGGVTRMLAMFTDLSDIESIGTVRSIRPYYAQIAFGYDAIIAHAGGSEAAYSLLRSTGWNHLDGVRETYAAAPFARDPDRIHNGLEHSLFADGSKLVQAAEEKGFDFEHEGGEYDYGLKFSEDAVEQCTGTAEFAQITFNTYKSMSFDYNSEDGLYYANQYGDKYIDENTGEQVSYTNLIFLSTDISIIDGYGRLEVRTTGEGSGWFCTGGKWVEITWEREDEYSPYHFYLDDGTELQLGIGHTYVGIMSSDGSATVSFEREEA